MDIEMGSEAELIRALEAMKDDGRGGLTTAQISEALGVSFCVAGRRVRDWVRAGEWQCVGRVQVPTIDGSTHRVPAYAPRSGS